MLIEPMATPVVTSTFTLLPLYQGLEPYLVAAIGGIITVVGAWLCLQIKTYMNITVDASLSAQLNQAAMNAATRVIAGMEGPIANLPIDIDSPMVTEGAQYVLSHIPSVLEQLNYTPQQLRELVLAKLGAAQIVASSTSSMATPCPTAVKMAERSAF